MGRPPRPEQAPIGGYGAGGSLRPEVTSVVAADEATAAWTDNKLCAWFLKRRSGLGSLLGNKRLFFTIDSDSRTLSWAKRCEENPKGSIDFKDIISVQSKVVDLENAGAQEAGEQDSSDAARPLSRASSTSSQRSISARVRSMSPFRKLKAPQYALVISTTGQQMELECDSKLQIDQWLAALESVLTSRDGSSHQSLPSRPAPKPLDMEIEQTANLQAGPSTLASAADALQDPYHDMLTTNAHQYLERAKLTGTACELRSDASTACSSCAQSRGQSQTRSRDPHSRERSCTPPHARSQAIVDLKMEEVHDDGEVLVQPTIPPLLDSTRNVGKPQSSVSNTAHSDLVSGHSTPRRSVSKTTHDSGKQNLCTNACELDQKTTPQSRLMEGVTKSQSSPSKTMQDPTEQSACINACEDGQHKAPPEEVETRRMFDKRELRRRNKETFEQQLSAWRLKHPRGCQMRVGPVGLDKRRVRVCVRKRPLFPHEEESEFDSISVNGSEVIVHNCLTKADLKTLFVSHMGFHFGNAFGEGSDDSEVYGQCAGPAVQYALQGGSATIFMFGQTGSGKTHTMQALLGQASAALFAVGGLEKAYVGAFEIAGKNLRDLQDPENPDKGLKVVLNLSSAEAQPGQVEEQVDGKVSTQIQGLKWAVVESAADLIQKCQSAQDRRATRATQANSVSSRSHSIVRIGRSEEDICLTLVDCAGSERNEDSTHHSAQDRRDAADINSSIFALKECFRVIYEGKQQQPPFRNNLLTRVLADSFTDESARFIAIGTVSPSSKDTEHSIETLRSLQMLQGTNMTFDIKEDVKVDSGPILKHPRNWSVDEVRTWMEGAVEGRAAPWVSGLPTNTDGKMFVRMPAIRFAQLCGSNKELGDMIYKELHQEMKRADESRRKKV